MENRDRLINIVAKKLNKDASIVREAVKIQHQMLKVTMQFDKNRTFYLRKVGYFQHTETRKRLIEEKLERVENNNKSNNEDIEDPYEFN